MIDRWSVPCRCIGFVLLGGVIGELDDDRGFDLERFERTCAGRHCFRSHHFRFAGPLKESAVLGIAVVALKAPLFRP